MQDEKVVDSPSKSFIDKTPSCVHTVSAFSASTDLTLTRFVSLKIFTNWLTLHTHALKMFRFKCHQNFIPSSQTGTQHLEAPLVDSSHPSQMPVRHSTMITLGQRLTDADAKTHMFVERAT